jgi:hypothetical protein
VNGLRLRGFDADTDRVSVQSSECGSYLLTRRRFSFLPAKWTEITCGKDELLVLKCNHGATEIELESLGGPFGDLILDRDRVRSRIRRGERVRISLSPDRAVFVHTAALRHAWYRDRNVGPVTAWAERRTA